MKDFIDKYGNKGKKTDDGKLRLTIHYDKAKPSVVRYIRLADHNGRSVCISHLKINEVIAILKTYL